ncbi:MAG: transferase hexapeptide repeat family protein [Planctomycetes bacterium]|nr:transferase hexapeptide repeat family protein [Planctomycetota bacterium]
MPTYEFEGIRPVIDPTAFVHPTASIIGDVIIGPGCLVAPGASLRGDLGRIEMKRGSNVQDNCTVHTFPGKDCTVEEDGHVGHGAVLHGCTVGRNCLVGMNAVVMDDVVLGEASFVGAMAFVRAGTVVPAGALVAGVPAKVIRTLSDDEIGWKTRGTIVYQRLAQRYRETFGEVAAHTVVAPDRPRVPDAMYEPKHEQR